MIYYDDLVTMARTVWGEARGESLIGQIAVAAVILNRSKRRWSDNVHEVCLQPWQFSCWNDNDPNRRKMLEQPMDSPSMETAFDACLAAIQGDDPSKGADHYFTKYIPPPIWAADMTATADIGVHLFYKE